MNEIINLKKEQLNDKELYEKEKKEWIAQRTEIEHEISTLKTKLTNKTKFPPSITYDDFNTLYKDYIGESVTLNSESEITFNLKEDN